MNSFFNRLERRAKQINSLLCVGLDPRPQDLSQNNVTGLREFCLRLIEATADYALAYKPNVAFFEAYGADGWETLQSIIKAVPDDIPVVLDAKRGDISSTADAYARATFETLAADAVTLSPYLGHDSLAPFLKYPEHGVFLLCKTSNPGSADFQDLTVMDSGPSVLLYEKVALLAQKWNTNSNIGLVVGATHPQALARLRSLTPDLWFLTPGVGAQGGDLKSSLAAGLRPDGMGMLVPVSRAISEAADPRSAACQLVEAMQEARSSTKLFARPEKGIAGLPASLEKLADGLLKSGCVRFGNFKLKSGLMSPIYIDLRRLVSYPDVLAEVAAAYIPLLRSLEFDRIAGLPYAALPIATGVSLQSGWPMLYPRKEIKDYGTRAEIEGEYNPGEQIVVIDDLTTTGSSKFEVIEKLTAVDLVVKDIVVLIDRQSGAREALAEKGYQLHSVLSLTDLLNYWEKTGKIERQHIDAARAFLKG